MSFLSRMFAAQDTTTPFTVDEAISDLTLALDNLAAVSVDRRAEAAALHAQAATIAEAAKTAEAEADRADRIHDNIATLLK